MLTAAFAASGQKYGTIVNGMLEEYLPKMIRGRIELLQKVADGYEKNTKEEVTEATRKIEKATRPGRRKAR